MKWGRAPKPELMGRQSDHPTLPQQKVLGFWAPKPGMRPSGSLHQPGADAGGDRGHRGHLPLRHGGRASECTWLWGGVYGLTRPYSGLILRVLDYTPISNRNWGGSPLKGGVGGDQPGDPARVCRVSISLWHFEALSQLLKATWTAAREGGRH